MFKRGEFKRGKKRISDRSAIDGKKGVGGILSHQRRERNFGGKTISSGLGCAHCYVSSKQTNGR